MMRKVALVALAMLLAVSFSGTAFAQSGSAGGSGGQLGPNEMFQQKLGAAKSMTFEGTVLSHDVACHCIVLKGAKGNLTLQDDYAKFDQDYDRAKGVKAGAKVKGSYKVVDYINYATEIHMAN
jgi:hypothetical protein